MAKVSEKLADCCCLLGKEDVTNYFHAQRSRRNHFNRNDPNQKNNHTPLYPFHPSVSQDLAVTRCP